MSRHPFAARQPDQRPDPRLHRADEADLGAAEAAGRRPAGRGRRRGGPPRLGLAPAPAPHLAAPERPLGLPDGRALPLHPRPRASCTRPACGRAISIRRCGRPSRRPRSARRPLDAAAAVPSEGLVVETLRVAGPAPRRRPRSVRPLLRRPRPARLPGPGRRAPAGRQAADPRGPQPAHHRARARRRRSPGLRRAPGSVAERDGFAPGRGDRPALGRVPRLEARPGRPVDAPLGALVSSRSCRASSPSTTSTTSAATPTSPASRPGRSTSSGSCATRSSAERGLTLYEPGLGALEMFLTARLFLYQQVYFHRTVRAIDLDLAEVFGPSIRAIFGDALAGRGAGRLRGPRRVRAPPPGRALGARRGGRRATRTPGDGRVTPGRRRRLAGDPPAPPALAGRGRGPAGLRGRRRRPTRWPASGPEEPGRVVIDLADRRRAAGRRHGDRFAARGRGSRRSAGGRP